jgi:hypothetical protein
MQRGDGQPAADGATPVPWIRSTLEKEKVSKAEAVILGLVVLYLKIKDL